MIEYFLMGAIALAQESIQLEVVHTVHAPRQPELILLPQVDASHIEVSLRCGQLDVRHTGPATSGSKVRIAIPVNHGKHTCTGTLFGMFTDGSQGEMPLQFQVAVQRPLTLGATANDVDLENGTLNVHVDQPLRMLELRVFGENGKQTNSVVISDVSSSPVQLSWQPPTQKVLRLAVIATTTTGLHATLDLFPWSYQIPHQDVVFPTGTAAIPRSEFSKLEAVMKTIQAVMSDFNKDSLGFTVPMALYVAGFTDTVGNRINNQKLSEQRAKALGRWFQNHGFQGPIHYQGLGENGLAVATADEVAHPANRRAVYIIAVEPPKTSALLPTSNWQPLR